MAGMAVVRGAAAARSSSSSSSAGAAVRLAPRPRLLLCAAAPRRLPLASGPASAAAPSSARGVRCSADPSRGSVPSEPDSGPACLAALGLLGWLLRMLPWALAACLGYQLTRDTSAAAQVVLPRLAQAALLWVGGKQMQANGAQRCAQVLSRPPPASAASWQARGMAEQRSKCQLALATMMAKAGLWAQVLAIWTVVEASCQLAISEYPALQLLDAAADAAQVAGVYLLAFMGMHLFHHFWKALAALSAFQALARERHHANTLQRSAMQAASTGAVS